MATVDNEAAMRDLAQRYAEELQAKFRTLSFFTSHGGEVGRVHEEFLADCLRRFLPPNIHIGTGFVASNNWTSTQQDILLYDLSRGPLLFEAGACVVLDRWCFRGAVSVKTSLKSRKAIAEEVDKIAVFRQQCGRSGFHGLYAWDAATQETVLDCLWDLLESQGIPHVALLPSAIYAARRFVLLKHDDGQLDSPVYHSLTLDRDGSDEGLGLMAFLDHAGHYGRLFDQQPWWLRGTADLIRTRTVPLPWPDRLQPRMRDELARRRVKNG